jgi:hypothetical protein
MAHEYLERTLILKRFGIVIVLCATFGGAPPLFAQQSVDSASVAGRVIDSSGAVVPGARVTARQTDTNVASTSVSDEEGRFHTRLRFGNTASRTPSTA